MIMKAIHNSETTMEMWQRVVIGLSKIMIMKAIHNLSLVSHTATPVVIGLSKIMIMKAIHNQVVQCGLPAWL